MKILLCDDHSLFGEGLSEILSKQGYELSVANSSAGCIHQLSKNKFDVFLCDLNIDSINGFDLILEMKPYLIDTKVFLLTAYREDFIEEKAKKNGFNGFLTKETSTEDLLKAIGMKKNSPFFSSLKNNSTNFVIENVKDFPAKLLRLSKQEKEIIKHIAQGKSSKTIADILFISKNTVDTHRRNINRKLELNSLGSLVKYAHENNLCD